MSDVVGILGIGKMGGALLRGLLATGYDPRRIHVATRQPVVLEAAAELGVWTHADNRELAKSVEILVLAVKPKDVSNALQDLVDLREGSLVISLVAGVRVATLAAGLPLHAKILRAMGNTPCLVRSGVTSFYPGPGVGTAEIQRACAVFDPLGATEIIPDEKWMDAVTAISACGPAFFFTALEALADGGVLMGLPRDLAHRLAVLTMRGAAELCLQRGDHPARLREEVASPGGTTIHGLRALEAGGFRSALIAAVEAATRRGNELGKERP
jgi:pyrroline-5-carboxylate reductase